MDLTQLSSAAALFKNPVPTHGPKRNTACHQCRKRKLKCDTKRPCSTCVRSHAYAVAHAASGDEVPDEPECTYGELPKEPQPKNKVEKLENRIGELEDLLKQMQVALQASQTQAQPIVDQSPNHYPYNGGSPQIPSDAPSPDTNRFTNSPSPFNGTSSSSEGAASQQMFITSSAALTPDAVMYDHVFSQMTPTDTANDVVEFNMMDMDSMAVELGLTPAEAELMADPASLSEFNDPMMMAMVPRMGTQDRRTQLLLMGWPLHLPEPEVTRHLVHAFFAFNMHAGRLFHGPTFLASLELPPSEPSFPFPGLLHIMCAIGSLYTADIPQPPMQPRARNYPSNGQVFALDELFPGRWRQFEQRPDSFAEQQAKFAKIAGEAALDRGEHLEECLQTLILLSWFYTVQARWSESFLAAGHSLRCCIPLGLNMSSPFHPHAARDPTSTQPSPSILPEPKNITNHEMRRNMFWVAYAIERMHGAGSSFAMALDDHDICQLLPMRGDQYEQGVDVPTSDRQWAHDPSALLTHPPQQTDSFILYIKSSILVSLVKTFNMRTRVRMVVASGKSAGFSTCGPIPFAEGCAFSPGTVGDGTFDVRDTPAFQALDRLVGAFRGSFPPHLRNPVQDEMIDAYLYAASCATHLAQILLHEPHAKMATPGDVSASRVLYGARAILDLMYAIGSTSYDVSLLDQSPILAWNVAGRVLVKALRAAIDTKNYEQMVILQAEITFVHGMLAKAGERMPLAYRYKKMVYDFLAATCGKQFVTSLPESSYHKTGVQEFTTPYDDPRFMGYSPQPQPHAQFSAL